MVNSALLLSVAIYGATELYHSYVHTVEYILAFSPLCREYAVESYRIGKLNTAILRRLPNTPDQRKLNTYIQQIGKAKS